MVSNVSTFLRLLKADLAHNVKECGRIKVTIGNESADFDSIVSAISYAYLDHVKNPTEITVPIISISREDLLLRRDVTFALQKLDIDLNWLYFNEDLKKFSKLYKIIDTILVDHNTLNKNITPNINEVVGIIDHHKDAYLYKSVKPRIIDTAGSCSSLIFNYWRQILGESSALTDVVPLTLGAVLIDTSNFKYKVEHHDLEALEYYKTVFDEKGMNKYYDELLEAKNDIEGLSFKDVLRKDYKCFNIENESSKNIKIGISSIVKPISWLSASYGGINSIYEECVAYAEKLQLNILVLMTATYNETTGFSRELVMVPGKADAEVASKVLTSIKEKLELKPVTESFASISETQHFWHYNQMNVQSSRKQVAPMLEDAWKNQF